MPSDVQLLTYDEIARAFGINRESARQLVIRKRWMRRKGNDGKARIAVPSEALDAVRTSDDTSKSTAAEASDGTGHDPSDDTCVVTVLSRHIERLEADLVTAKEEIAVVKTERDAQRAIAAQVDVLTAILEVEQRRAGELREERDKWHAAAMAPRRLFGWLRRINP